jgi:hypothetical protein
MVATTPVVRWKSKIASCSWASMTLRSETTSTVSNSLRCSASCRSARKWAVQAMELVLPEPGRVLDQVLPAGPSSSTVADQLPGDVELVVAGEDDGLDLLLRVPLGDQVAAQDLQPALPLPDLLPEVGGAVPVGLSGIALAAVVAPVERQEGRRRACQPGGHVDLALLTAKCTRAPPGKLSRGSAANCPFGFG